MAKTFRFLKDHWLWVYIFSGILLPASLILNTSWRTTIPAVGQSVFHFESIAVVISLLALAGLTFSSVSRILNQKNRASGIALLILAFVYTTVILAFIPESWGQHVGDTRFNGHLYRLDVFPVNSGGEKPTGNDFSYKDLYVISQCDLAGIFCNTIHHELTNCGFFDRPACKNPFLATDSQSIFLNIGGQKLFMYNPGESNP